MTPCEGATAIPDIFISYNREDQVAARRFAEAFSAEGLDVWWDATLQSGDAYDQVTEKALNEAKAVVVLWSPRSVGSRWVRAEATVADRNGTLVPCMIEQCHRPVMFELTQTADMTSWNGDRGAIAWRDLVAAVRRQVGLDGSARSVPAASIPQKAASHRDRPGLVILPFRCGGEDIDFAEGLADETVTIFDRYKYVLNIVGQPAGARFRIEGSLRRSGGLSRLSARLLDCQTEAQVWAGRLDSSHDNPFAAQENLAQQLAAQVAQAIETTETQWALTRPLEELGAYHRLLIGLQTVREFTAESEARAVRILTDAAAEYPSDAYILSLASLSCCLLLALGGSSDIEHTKATGREFVRRAVHIGGDDPQVLGWAALGGLACGSDITMLDALIDRALERNPGWSSMWTWNAHVKLAKGDVELALERAEKAISLDPRSVDRFVMLTTMGGALMFLGRYEEAVAPLTEAEQLVSGWPGALIMLVAVYVHLGRMEDAKLARRTLTESVEEIQIETIRLPEHRAFLREAFAKVPAD